MEIGEIWKQNCGDSLMIIGKEKKNQREGYEYRVKFLNYPNVLDRLCKGSNIKSGQVVNYLIPTIFGKACLGVGNYHKKTHTKIYDIWFSILKRCYNENHSKYRFYGAKGVIVCDEWLNFQNFAAWYEENSKWNEKTNYQLELDKDILCYINKKESKIYSPTTCLLIPGILNGYVTDGNNIKSGITIRRNKSGIKFSADVTIKDKREYLGTFDNFVKAKDSIIKRKNEGWIKFVNEYKLPENLKNILLQYNFNCEDTEGWRELTNEEIIQKYF